MHTSKPEKPYTINPAYLGTYKSSFSSTYLFLDIFNICPPSIKMVPTTIKSKQVGKMKRADIQMILIPLIIRGEFRKDNSVLTEFEHQVRAR